MLINRVLVALPLLAAAGAIFWRGAPWMWETATFVAALWALWEWGRLGGLRGRAAAGYAALSAAFMLAGKFLLDGNLGAADAMFGGACLFWATAAPALMLSGFPLRRAAFYAAGMLTIFAAWYASAVMFVNDPDALLAVLAVVWTADSAAYFVGRRWGKKQMSPRISPGKTWEGFFGGMFCALTLAFLCGPLLFVAPPPAWLLAATAAVVALAVLGDLFESEIKRRGGVKDSGGVLGAHGGVLDRLDAMLPALPFGALLSPWLN
ncbi:MAG: phosphatidate cytidylyltransferase [Gammaproteobacteria bacterium]